MVRLCSATSCDDDAPGGAPASEVAEWGELQLRGANAFLGYHGKDHLTNEAYDADGWLRTGDLVRRGPLGAFAFEGQPYFLARPLLL